MLGEGTTSTEVSKMPNRTFSSGQGHLADIIMFPLSLSLSVFGAGAGIWVLDLRKCMSFSHGRGEHYSRSLPL